MMLDDLELELRKLPGVRSTGFDESDEILLVQLHVGPGRGDPTLAAQATRIAVRHSDRPVAVEIVRWRTATAPPAEAAVGGMPGVGPAHPHSGNGSVDLEALGTIALDPNGVASDAAPAGDAGAGDPAATDHAPSDEAAAERIEGRRARLLAVLSFPDTDEIEVHLLVGDRRTIGRAPASAGIVAAAEATLEAIRQIGAPMTPRTRWVRALDSTGDDEMPLVAVAIEGEEQLHFGLAGGMSAIDAAARSTLDALNRRLSLFL